MSKSLIISSESSNLYSTKRFVEEAKRLKFKTIVQNPYEQVLTIKQIKLIEAEQIYLHRTSGIRYDDFDLTVAEYYQAAGVMILNSLDSIKPFREKDSQIIFFHKNKIETIETLLFRGEVNEQLIKALTSLSPKKVFNEEFIIKMNRGNGGIGVQKINGLDSLISILETFHAIKDQKMLIQPFYSHSLEYRAFMTNKGQLEIIERNIAKNDFRANKKRATGKYLKKPSKELIQFCERAFSKTNLSYAGIDLLKAKSDYKVIEINSVPGFEQVEKLAGKNIAREILLLK